MYEKTYWFYMPEFESESLSERSKHLLVLCTLVL